MNKRNKSIIVATCLKENKKNSYKKIWDEIIKSTIEKRYGKIK